MSLTISRGSPQYSGRYVCYVDDFTVPTKILTWLCEGSGGRWLADLPDKLPPHTRVNGWIGPLPALPAYKQPKAPAQEFDL
jgi:hypothetical protein